MDTGAVGSLLSEKSSLEASSSTSKWLKKQIDTGTGKSKSFVCWSPHSGVRKTTNTDGSVRKQVGTERVKNTSFFCWNLHPTVQKALRGQIPSCTQSKDDCGCLDGYLRTWKSSVESENFTFETLFGPCTWRRPSSELRSTHKYEDETYKNADYRPLGDHCTNSSGLNESPLSKVHGIRLGQGQKTAGFDRNEARRSAGMVVGMRQW